eukprot:2135696-Prymnesium_polylepis.1
MRVYVEAHTLDLRTGSREQTNEFHIVFNATQPVAVVDAASSDAPLLTQPMSATAVAAPPRGVGDGMVGAEARGPGAAPPLHPGMQPSSYEEAMLYLEGRRRWLAAFAFASDAASKL